MEALLGKAVWAARLTTLAILAIATLISFTSHADSDSRRRDSETIANLRNDFVVTYDGILVFSCDTPAIEVREKLRDAGKRALQPDVRCVLLCLGHDSSTRSWEDVLTLDIWLRSDLLRGTSGRHYFYFEEGTDTLVSLPCLYMYKRSSTISFPKTEQWQSATGAFRTELLLMLREAEISGNAQTTKRVSELIEQTKDDQAVVEFLTQRYDIRAELINRGQGAQSQIDAIHLASPIASLRFAPWPLGAQQDSAIHALEQLRKDLPKHDSCALTVRCVTGVAVSVLVLLTAVFALLAPSRLPRIALSDQSTLKAFAVGTTLMLGPSIALVAPLARISHTEQVLTPFVIGFGGWWYYPVAFAARLLVGIVGVCWIVPTLYPDQSDPRLRRNLALIVCLVASLVPAVSGAAEARLFLPTLFDFGTGGSFGIDLLLLQLIFCLAVTLLLLFTYNVSPKSPLKACGGRSSQFKFVALLVVSALTPVLAAPMTLSSTASGNFFDSFLT